MIKFKKDGEGLSNLNIDKPEVQIYKYFPNVMSCIICGPTGSGKTTIVVKILTDNKHGLFFKHIYICSKTRNQDKYKYLYLWIQNMNKKLKKFKIGITTFENTDDVISVDDAESNSVIIFDDIDTHKAKIVEDYFSRGRHKKIHRFYLCQTISRIPKQMIRDNANMIILIKIIDSTNLKHVYDDYVGSDMNFKDFMSVCTICMKDKYNHLDINLEKDINNGKYRRNFNEIIHKKNT